MPVVTFTAKRSILRRGVYSVTSAAISAAAVDGSFNSASTDLSGLLAGDWVNTSGFANSANNDWFQLAANSTAAKIDTTGTTIVDEAVGQTVVIVGYQHGYGQSYSIEFNADVLQPSYPARKNRVEALDGSADTFLFWNAKAWSVTASVIHNNDLPLWEEFLASVIGGESFTFDPNGTIAVPDAPVTVELDGDYSIPRNGESFDFNPTFKVRVM